MNRPLKIGILEGDDIGLEVVPETVKVMRAAAQKCALEIDWRPLPIGRKAYDELGYTLPPGTLETLATFDGWVLGPIGHQAYRKELPNFINPHPILRKHFDLFANIRPAKSLPGLTGGLGLAAGLSAGPHRAMAQATHGSAPDIAGKGVANPYAMIMSGQMLMAWLGHKHDEPKAVEAAARMERAMESVIAAGRVLTPDLGGKASTTEMGDAVAAAVANG